jgi:hypothetical protein
MSGLAGSRPTTGEEVGADAGGAVKSFFWRWLHRLPSPFTVADMRAGYTYDLAFRQFEVSDTRVFDRPAAGRAFFEGVIRDHLDVGRPCTVPNLAIGPLSCCFVAVVRLPGGTR